MQHLQEQVAAVHRHNNCRHKGAIWGNLYGTCAARRAMVYQMLLAVPFSSFAMAQAVRPAGVVPPVVVECTATLFDITVLPNNELRPLATRWVDWAAKRLRQLAAIIALARAALQQRTETTSVQRTRHPRPRASSTSPAPVRGRGSVRSRSTTGRRASSASPAPVSTHRARS